MHEVEGISWREAYARVELPNPFNIDDDEPPEARADPRPEVNEFPRFLTQVSEHKFPTYLRMRKYGIDDARRFGLHYGEAGDYRGYLVFPFWDLDGKYVTYTARYMEDVSGRRYRQPDQSVASRYLYGLWLLRGLERIDQIFVVEGQTDVMRMWSYGVPTVGLSTIESSAAQRNQLFQLATQYQVPIRVLLDNGETERRFAESLAYNLSCSGVVTTVLDMPDGVKDPDKMSVSDLNVVLDKCKDDSVNLDTWLR